MIIKPYNNTAEPNRLDKRTFLTEYPQFEGTLRDDTSIINPIIEVERNDIQDIININYIYIDAFKRYYFVTDIIVTNMGLWEIHLKVDVLMSFRTKLILLDGFVERCEDEIHWNKFLPDSEVPTQNNEIVDVVVRNPQQYNVPAFKSSSFNARDNEYNYLLIVYA